MTQHEHLTCLAADGWTTDPASKSGFKRITSVPPRFDSDKHFTRLLLLVDVPNPPRFELMPTTYLVR